MTSISSTIANVAKLHSEVGTAELARMSGVPYTTIVDQAARGWRSRSIDVLEKLEAAAQKRSADKIAT